MHALTKLFWWTLAVVTCICMTPLLAYAVSVNTAFSGNRVRVFK